MVVTNPKIIPSHIHKGTGNYFLALQQISGIALITLFSAVAWVLIHLPWSPAYTAITGYGLGLVLFLPGIFLTTRKRMGGKALLGSGTALLFLVTETFLFGMHAFHFPFHPYGAIVVCAGILTLFAIPAWRASSQSISLLTIFLALYTFYGVAPHLSVTAQGVLFLIGIVLLILWIFLWTTYRSERLFTHFALFFGYGALYVMGYRNGISPLWILSVLLFYVSMTALSVDQVFRDHNRHRSLLFFSCANTLLYVLTTLLFTSSSYAGHLWLMLLAAAIVNTFAALALYLVHREGFLISMYAVAAVLALLISLLLPLAPGLRLMVLASACLVPVLVSSWRSSRLLSFSEYGLLFLVFIASFDLHDQTKPVLWGPFSIPAQWAWLLAAATILCIISCFYSLRDLRKNDKPSICHNGYELSAILYAFTAALLITLHTILLRGDNESLPVILAAQGMVFLGLGMILFTPTLSLAGLIPVIAGHTIYYAFPYLTASAVWTAAEMQAEHVYILFIATLVLALFTDYLLLKRLGSKTSLIEKMLAAIPYLPALTLLLLTAIEYIPVLYLPALTGMISLVLLLPFRLHRGNMPGMTALGSGMALLSVAAFFYALFTPIVPAYSLSLYLPLLGGYLLCLILLERFSTSSGTPPTWRQSLFSYSLIALTALIGAIGLYGWNNGGIYFASLPGLSLLLIISGRIFHAKAYYHVAFLLVFFALVFLLLFGSQGMNALTAGIPGA